MLQLSLTKLPHKAATTRTQAVSPSPPPRICYLLLWRLLRLLAGKRVYIRHSHDLCVSGVHYALSLFLGLIRSGACAPRSELGKKGRMAVNYKIHYDCNLGHAYMCREQHGAMELRQQRLLWHAHRWFV